MPSFEQRRYRSLNSRQSTLPVSAVATFSPFPIISGSWLDTAALSARNGPVQSLFARSPSLDVAAPKSISHYLLTALRLLLILVSRLRCGLRHNELSDECGPTNEAREKIGSEGNAKISIGWIVIQTLWYRGLREHGCIAVSRVPVSRVECRGRH